MIESLNIVCVVYSINKMKSKIEAILEIIEEEIEEKKKASLREESEREQGYNIGFLTACTMIKSMIEDEMPGRTKENFIF